MDLKHLEHAFTNLLKQEKTKCWGLAPIATAGLQTRTEDLRTAEAAWEALAQAAPSAGWIQWQSHQTHFFEGTLPEPNPAWGAVLAAEVVVSDSESLRLDFLDDRWRLTRYHHNADAAEYLCDETSHLLHGTRNRFLRYRRYWRIDADQGAVQTHAVLTGIE